jgi:beta-lactamase regulating signal transducer with metallopeptidase domain
MTAFGIQLGWLTLKVTVVALLARALLLWTSRHTGRSSVAVLAGAMAALFALTAAAVCPPQEFQHLFHLLSRPPDLGNLDPVAHASADIQSDVKPEEGGLALSRAWAWLGDLSGRVPASGAWQHVWTVLTAIYVAGVVSATIHLLAGWLALGRLRRRSLPIRDPYMIALMESLRQAIRHPGLVQLCECAEPGLAATIGWRRPAILLPVEWRSWTADERRAVLAHELAHVRHRDYLIAVCSSICRLVHFYHPLVRWLSGQLRRQQEVAADALAVQATGDRDTYVKSLARLALRAPARTPPGAMAWSATTGPTLLWRIHMLRGTEKRRPLGRLGQVVIIALLAGTALLVSTLGGQTPLTAAEEASVHQEPYDLGYLSENAKGFMACRPAVWFKQPGMDKASALIDQGLAMLKQLGVAWPKDLRPEHIEQFVADLHINSAGTGKPGSRSLMFGASAMLIRMDRDFDWLACVKSVHEQVKRFLAHQEKEKQIEDITESHRDGVTIYRLGVIPIMGPVPVYMHLPDSRSMVLSFTMPKNKEDDFVKLLAHAAEARKRDWGSGWKQIANAPFVAVIDNHKGHYTKLHQKDLDAKDLKTLDEIRFAALAIELGDGKPVCLSVDAKSNAAVPMLLKAFEGYAHLALDAIREEKAHADKHEEPETDSDRLMMKLSTELLQSRQVHRHGSSIEWQGFSSVRVRDLVEVMPPVSPGRKTSIEVKEVK